MKNLKIPLLFLIFFTISFTMQGQDEARLLRFPAIHGNQIVFSYAGDLYTVTTEGGMARKLTSDIGYEMFARFAPDGKTIAFTAQYDGNTEIYSMPAEGGVPQRLTYTATLGRDDISDRMGPNNITMTWTPGGDSIVYRSRKQSFNSFKGQLFKVSKDGGLSDELPLPTGGFCSYSPDGKKLAYNRVFREFRTWKYYHGGMADDVWIYDFDTKETVNITDNIAQDIFPMWHGTDVYFLSDRDRTMNLFVYNTETKEIKKVTDFTEYDIKFPSIGKDKIVFENGGYIYVFDTNTQQAEKVEITLADDFNHGRNEWKDAKENIHSVSLAPGGKRLAFSARGEIFTVPVEHGITRNLTKSSDAHDRTVEWSPDGKYIAYISDKSGEDEIYIQKQDGSEPPQQITTGGDTYKYSIQWSPDSKKILWSDKKTRLQYVDIETKKVTLVEQSDIDVYYNFNWSPDSKWIVYSRPSLTMKKVVLYNLASKEKTEVTDGWYDSNRATFSSDGKYVVFVSQRHFNPIYSDTEWNHAYENMNAIYLVTLAKSTPSPFAPENDEVETEDDTDSDSSEEEVSVTIDTEGIQSRVIEIPVDAANYWNVNLVGNKLYYIKYKVHSGEGAKFMMYDLDKQKETELASGYYYSLAPDNKKMLVYKSKSYSVIDLPSSKISVSETVDLSGMKVLINNHEEWQQIFDEAWRQMRDFFYVENMHGVDWEAMHEKYGQMIPHVQHRADLNYLIGEMIGELNVGHAYINGGDTPDIERIKTGLLGAKLSRHESGFYQIDEILDGANWSDKLRSPLQAIGIDISKGDYIIAVNGETTKTMNDIYAALVGQAGRIVELTVNDTPSESGSHTELVKPIADEADLYYYNWVQNNIRIVDEATNGRVGYIHVPDMGPEGLNEFVKHFYPQLMKDALIIDDRGNGGGNVSPMLIERLNREIFRAKSRRNMTAGRPVPSQTHVGPKVMLIDNYSASDGDQFPHAFQKLGMGKVIGVRSWGGVVGIWGSLPFVDGTSLRKPESASYSVDTGEWIIEGWGVEPDIVVDNDPAKLYQGIDEQLNKAIEVILEELKEWEQEIPPVPNPPDKSGNNE